MNRKIIADLKDYAFETMNNSDFASEHFFWKGQYLAYSNVLEMMDERLEELKAVNDEYVKNMTQEEAKKLLSAIFNSKRELIDDGGYEFDE